MNSFRKVAAAVAMVGLMLPAAASAQTVSSSTQALLDQLKALQAQQQTIIGQLFTTLNVGSSGDGVKQLQQLLAQDPSIYPEGKISGFFGARTAAAVKRFQKRHGLEQAGRVGPQTLKKINEIFGHNGSSTPTSFGTSTKGREGGNDNDDNRGNKPCIAPGVVGLPGFVTGHGERGEQGEKENKGNKGRGEDNRPCTGTTTPPVVPPVVTDTTAPVISGLSAASIATTTATISWNTNESATGKVYFGIVNPLVLASATSNATTTLSGAHSFVLTGLSASTTYYFVAESKDAANNTGTSTQGSFTTTN